MAPKVDVLVQSYNHAPFVRQCIATILNQTYSNIALSVVDDGSTDGSHHILTELSSKHGFSYRHQKNKGLVPTILDMISETDGEYLCLQASDDYWPLEKLQRQVHFLESNPDVSVVAGNALCVNNQGRAIRQQRYQSIKVQGNCTFDDVFLSRVSIAGPTTLLRRASLEGLHCFDPGYPIEDFYLWLTLLANGRKIELLPTTDACYRIHGANSHRKLEWMQTEVERILALYQTHPKYSYALRTFRKGLFSELAIENKLKAILLVAEVWSPSLSFMKQLSKILIPRKVWHSYWYQEYAYAIEKK